MQILFTSASNQITQNRILTHMQPSQFIYGTFSSRLCGFKNMNLAFKTSLSNCGQTLKNGCFTAKQAPGVRFKVIIVVLLTSLLGMMLCHWARSQPQFKGHSDFILRVKTLTMKALYNAWNFYNYTSNDTASHPKRPKFLSSWIPDYNWQHKSIKEILWR